MAKWQLRRLLHAIEYDGRANVPDAPVHATLLAAGVTIYLALSGTEPERKPHARPADAPARVALTSGGLAVTGRF